MEFLSIKVPDGPLTSRLQHIKPGDPVIVSRKPTGTLVLDDLKPGRHLYLLGTGTGLAPYMSLIREPDTYERFEKIVLVHGVRHVNDLAYADYIERELPRHEYLGEMVREKLIYYPHRHPRTLPPSGPHPAGDRKRPTQPRHRPAADHPHHRPGDAVRQPGDAGRAARAARRARLRRFAAHRRAWRLRVRARLRREVSKRAQSRTRPLPSLSQ